MRVRRAPTSWLIDWRSSTPIRSAWWCNPSTKGNLQPVTDTYSPGTACDVVLLRATYNWTVVTPLMSAFLVNMANSQHLLSATTAFRNEPFTSASGGC